MVMWPDSEELMMLLGCVLGYIGALDSTSRGALENRALAAITALFRGTQGETMLRRYARLPACLPISPCPVMADVGCPLRHLTAKCYGGQRLC
jgi:hypothetical protein